MSSNLMWLLVLIIQAIGYHRFIASMLHDLRELQRDLREIHEAAGERKAEFAAFIADMEREQPEVCRRVRARHLIEGRRFEE